MRLTQNSLQLDDPSIKERMKNWISYSLLGQIFDLYGEASKLSYYYPPTLAAPLLFHSYVYNSAGSFNGKWIVIVEFKGVDGDGDWLDSSNQGYYTRKGSAGNFQLTSNHPSVWVWVSVIAQIIAMFPEEDRYIMKCWLQVGIARLLAEQTADINHSVFETVNGAAVHRIAVATDSRMWAEVLDSTGTPRWIDASGQTDDALPGDVHILEVAS